MKAKTVEESKTIMTELIMPNDANPLGNLMGGNLMRWMDIAGGICGSKHCEAHVVTASVDHVSFSAPIRVGDVINIVAVVTRAFTTSLEVYIEVFATDITGNNTIRSNHAYMTFVALDKKTKKPIKVPQLQPLTAEQTKLYESAPRRREVRLVLSGRMKPQDATDLKAFFADF